MARASQGVTDLHSFGEPPQVKIGYARVLTREQNLDLQLKVH
jgi:hypothetical protein